jgi:hypothetical protein
VNAEEYKNQLRDKFRSWKAEGETLEPDEQVRRESELLAWHHEHVLEAEVASVQLPGGRAKLMNKIKKRVGEDVRGFIPIP